MEPVGPHRWFFDLWSWIYDAPWVQRRAYRPIHDAALEALETLGTRPARVLDLGCGTGQLAARLDARLPHGTIVGCDFSAGMLHQAAARSARLRLVQGDACRLPFADRSFDAVVCTEAFHWFPAPADALAECFRVLRPGGRLLLAVTNTPAVPVSRMIHFASRLVGEAFYWPSRGEGRRWIEHAGFRIESQRPVARIASQLLPPILTVAARPAARIRSARAHGVRSSHPRRPRIVATARRAGHRR